MSQHYTDPNRAKDSYSLPDLEIWPDAIATVSCERCGEFELPLSSATATETVYCPSCEREAQHTATSQDEKYWYWFCLPGCLPDSEPYGPYDTEDEALNAAQEQAGVDSDDEADENDEPQEDDLTTEDHEKFYQSGSCVLAKDQHSDKWTYRSEGARSGCYLTLGHFGDDHKAALRAYMEKTQYWPNCWFISDHGNAHRIEL